ncbi:GDP-mannose mannosyl hydrolase [Acinetobacter terrae]|uniref:GDP-mannose mannosyl hydrolase n=1 Tax=Acinetobacter terrae TaxID=2731247 RepID=A0ABX1V0M6_9GAMM|nr:GDP-mannose mannosyl hydrolase [Acinetobacter terrae]NNH86644.1 GDP-mannose mannosyl hydrolase [Acinetobacter terrae]
MWLPDEAFKSVIQNTPLISIDLIVCNGQGEILLGKRANAPAKGYWFVPGGRVRKNETLDDAFVRLVKEELGIKSGIARTDAKFLGVFEHFYENCVFGKNISTHYIVLAYELIFDFDLIIQVNSQHFEYSYSINLDGKKVHPYSLNYFGFI